MCLSLSTLQIIKFKNLETPAAPMVESRDASDDLIIIKVSSLLVKFGGTTILNNISLDLREGEIFGIVGMSGSGKTTLLNTLMGVIEPMNGTVFYKPQQIIRTREDRTQFRSIRSDPDNLKRTFGFSAQNPSFYTKLTVRENLDFFGTLNGLPREVKETNMEILLDLVGLTKAKDQLAERLSGGMQKRLDIACALIHNPHVLILDEPTADLDPVLRRQMWDLIRKINHRGTTVILASHFLEELETLCNRIAILFDREIVAVGTPLELQARFRSGEIVLVQTVSQSYGKLVSRLKDEFKLLEHHFVERHGKLEIRVPEVQVLIEELSEARDLDPKAAEKLIVPSLSAARVLERVMRICEQLGEQPTYLVASKADLDHIFEAIVSGGKR